MSQACYRLKKIDSWPSWSVKHFHKGTLGRKLEYTNRSMIVEFQYIFLCARMSMFSMLQRRNYRSEVGEKKLNINNSV